MIFNIRTSALYLSHPQIISAIFIRIIHVGTSAHPHFTPAQITLPTVEKQNSLPGWISYSGIFIQIVTSYTRHTIKLIIQHFFKITTGTSSTIETETITFLPRLRSGSGFGTTVFRAVRIGFFLLLDYYIEYLIEYSSTPWIPEVAINHRVVQNKRIPNIVDRSDLLYLRIPGF